MKTEVEQIMNNPNYKPKMFKLSESINNDDNLSEIVVTKERYDSWNKRIIFG